MQGSDWRAFVDGFLTSSEPPVGRILYSSEVPFTTALGTTPLAAHQWSGIAFFPLPVLCPHGPSGSAWFVPEMNHLYPNSRFRVWSWGTPPGSVLTEVSREVRPESGPEVSPPLIVRGLAPSSDPLGP